MTSDLNCMVTLRTKMYRSRSPDVYNDGDSDHNEGGDDDVVVTMRTIQGRVY